MKSWALTPLGIFLATLVLSLLTPRLTLCDERPAGKLNADQSEKKESVLSWLIGDWRHANPDMYKKVEKLRVREVAESQSITVTYTYIDNPDFDERTHFECSEAIKLGQNGELDVTYAYKHLKGRGENLKGRYKLRPTGKSRWEGDSDYKGPWGEEEERLVVLEKRSNDSFALTTGNRTFVFRRIEGTTTSEDLPALTTGDHPKSNTRDQ